MKKIFNVIMCIAMSALMLTGVAAYADSAGCEVEDDAAISAITPFSKD